MLANATLNMQNSYYVASAVPHGERPLLQGAHAADLVVIGGGCTGLSAALHAAEAGLSVILLEAGRIGWGASGRNGGQMITGLRQSPGQLLATYGRDMAKALFQLTAEGRRLMEQLIVRHDIACDFKATGHLTAAVRQRDLEWMSEEAELLAEVMDYPHVRVLQPSGIRSEVDSPLYCGGYLDEKGAHLHPLNFTLGLADAAEKAGVRLFEGSAAVKIGDGTRVTVDTASGKVTARHAVIACDALVDGLEPFLAARIMPVGSYIAATEPLGDRAEALIPHDRAVADTLFSLHYFRLSADRRLLFSGGERYTPSHPQDIAASVMRHLPRVFPQLKGVRADYAWGGLVSVTKTRLPHFGRMGNRFFAHGYSGEGVIMSTLAGKLLAEAMTGTVERFDLFQKIAPPPFPGGTRFRYPLYILAMLWFALRDRI
ncbi:MAG TPA: FAD-binding oxidoreductase [Candidatus Sulfotelmatobacter sp.]|nr:FAD-binding oxidoreductase [Candidatus Sulfotelmatobacter sp.]